MSTACPSEQQIRDLAAGTIEDAEASLLRDHIQDCAECRQALEEWEADLAFVPVVRQALVGSRPGELTMETCSLDPSSLMREYLRGPSTGSETAISIPGYDIVREIHRGGQGIVYEAVQLATRRTVAVKVLLEGPLADERARWRFEREVKLVAALKHPNIVVIHDSGITQGRYFFAMDYVRGQPLDTHVRLTWGAGVSPAKTDRMPTPQVSELVRLFKQVVDAVAYAHKRGVIHRDLKPSNILVGEEGVPCVLDFGLAKMIGDELPDTQPGLVSMPGNIMGTLRYMSPEQTLGNSDSIDIRTDVYSLGVILYELLTGKAPYEVSTDLTAVFRNIREVDPARLSRRTSGVNSDLNAIVHKAMAKEPERRYQSAGELADDLAAWLDGRPVSAKSDSAFYVIRKLVVRHGFESAAVLAVLVAVISFGSLGLRGVLYGQSQKAARDVSEAALAGVDEARFLAETGIRESLRQMTLGWFLDEWHSGRLDRARALRDELPVGAPEHTAMSFLLDGHSIDHLREHMPAHAAPLMHFVIGERHASTGDLAAALDAFESSRQAAAGAGNRWWRQTAEARIEQLRKLESAETARAAEGGGQ
jgi:serine/threonine protein kinase